LVAKSVHYKGEMSIMLHEENFILEMRSTQLSECVNTSILRAL